MTEQTTLTDRYIYAATRSVPETGRADLRAELEASIRDAIDARVESGEQLDAAERTVLAELGDPDKLAADYTDRPTYLIGPRYYFEWRRLVRMLLLIVLPIAVFGVTLGQVISGSHAGEIFGTVIASGITITLNLLFWPTLVFAILERNAQPSPLERSRLTADGPWAPWTIERLPEIPERGAGLSDMIASLVFLVVAAAAVVWDRTIGFVWTHPQVSFLNPELWPWWITGLFVLIALEAALAVAVHATGRWTLPLAGLNAALNIALAVPALALLSAGQLINPDFFPTVNPDAAIVLANLAVGFTGVTIAVVALWDIVDAFIKATRARGLHTAS